MVSIFGLLTWISILVTHIYFVKVRRVQGITKDQMYYTAPLGIWGSYIALFVCIIVAFTKNFPVFTHNKKWGNFDYKTFITGYIGIPLYIIMIFGHMFIKKTWKGIKPEDVDFYSGKKQIDDEEERFLAQQAIDHANGTERGGKFYNRYVSWLFWAEVY